MRRTTAGALCGVLAGTVLLGAGGTMATLSDTETAAATAGAGAVDLAVVPQTSGTGVTASDLVTVTVDATSTGNTASLQLAAADAPGSRPCAEVAAAVTASVSADWLPPIAPVPLCELLDVKHPLVLASVGPAAPLSGKVLEVRLSGPDGQPVATQPWDGILTFTLVQGVAGFSATQDVPLHIAGVNPAEGSAAAGTAPDVPPPAAVEQPVIPAAEEIDASSDPDPSDPE